ncbi:trk system potassium uptake protein TrkA [Brevibacterium sanguinis]|uniref:Trk system potassium uptake protein TrkA n=2 Tax=Brevibacterium TaxID=1696 RepID=A0A366II57_9MICO|nr:MULTISPECIES: TrkA family potassium uptake protein [Brevibacterium]RBP63999.1 trk system potassium uptake protein TrkA [Brevibacterium sanguinis]RBP70726.1 trk system potassium uptake protein TrkA [Brevibacterium celere]
MHFVIMGCGRVGASLAKTLDGGGHTVAVVDRNPDAFLKLGRDFSGSTITGVGFDRDTLTQAGTADAYAFAAVSSGDNSNILAARVARETFGVANVAARIYDPHRAQVFERLGIPTVPTVRWTAEQVMRKLVPQGSITEYREPSGKLVLAEVHLDPGWVARPIQQIEDATKARVAYVTRLSSGVVAHDDLLIQDGDLVHLMCPVGRLGEIERILDQPPVISMEEE